MNLSAPAFSASLAGQLPSTLLTEGSNKTRQAPITNDTLQTDKKASLYSYLESTQRFELDLQTTDGDLITVNFESLQSEEQGFAYSDSGSSYSGVVTQISSSYSRYQMTFSGHLDEAEQTAVEDFLTDIGQIAQKFFSNNVQQAFDAANKLSYNAEEIANFSVDMNKSRLSIEQQAYSSSRYPQQELGPGLTLAELAKQLNAATIQQRDSKGIISDGPSTLEQMLSQESRFTDEIKERLSLLLDVAEQLAKQEEA